MAENKDLEKIVSWAKRRGYIMPGSEIYGGIGGIYDLGPYGVALKNNIKKLWWKTFVEDRDDVVGLESAILMNRKVWQASGHEAGFTDELVECKKCHQRFKADDVAEGKCPSGGAHELTEPKAFNAMFETYIGVVKDEDAKTYLRPETAQGMFTDFKQVLETSRKKLPVGIAQIGKCFRNEINTKDYLFRVREFEIAEIEYFVKPGDDEKSFDEWLKRWEEFVLSCGIKKENLQNYEHPKEGLAHYSKGTTDLQYNFPFGFKELAGVANRTDFDLKSHEEASGKDLKYFDEEAKEKYWPYVIEPTLGVERLLLAVICDAFEELESRTETTEAVTEKEIVLHLDPKLAPVKVAVFPLVKKISKEAREVYEDLKKCWPAEFDESGSIGRRYRRQDEIGTPFCVTFDFDSLEDQKVTVRDRDTMKQERVEIKELKNYLFEKLNII
ncbi:MAG: glycyl-tRNA synthetase, glycyl-tRNA synthetase [Berkelbacteria bacterium GW2011_GWE1_39_12]|uniref:Glycine--tRNA ligase n=1 Tax=Berkelbacteria bacterium GW2011_GWE1_39_12 TaxID=1618337 RepID=A0A0G4B1W3_9BACT|nr:MAG: glycyl-tRNA synthetase, glycyl-tRNA synthetase [Berkelbacteria bacterium GW2011_GWE1_39_12]